MPVQPTHNDNIVLGAGYLYFDKFDAAGNKTGERYLGQTPGFSINMASEKLEKYSSDGPIAEVMVSVTTQVTRSGTLVCDDISHENLALFIVGDIDLTGQAANASQTDTLDVMAGRSYQLGAGAGVVDVENVAVTQTSGSVVLVADTDYKVDEALGRVEFLDAAITTTPEEVTIDYDVKAKNDLIVVESTDQASQRGALRFIADNTVGEARNVYMPVVDLSPDGDFAFKSRDDFAQISFAFTVQKPADGGKAVVIYG